MLALAAAGLAVLLGVSSSIQIGALSIFDSVIFVVVVGEELGWRGFALPSLLEKRSALAASLILGVLWSAWHLPTFLVPGTPQYGKSIIAFVLMTTTYSVLLAWIYVHTAGSVLIATLVHGAMNLFQGIFLGGVDPTKQYWLLAASYGAAALAIVLVFGPSLSRSSGCLLRVEIRTPSRAGYETARVVRTASTVARECSRSVSSERWLASGTILWLPRLDRSASSW